VGVEEDFRRKYYQWFKENFISTLLNTLNNLREVEDPTDELINELISNLMKFSPENSEILPKLIALGMKMGYGVSVFIKDFERFVEESVKRIKKEMEEKIDREMGVI